MKFCSKLSFLEAFLLVQFLGKNTCISIIITYYGIYLTSTHDSSSHSKFKLFFRQYETKLIKFSDQRLKIVLKYLSIPVKFFEISHIESIQMILRMVKIFLNLLYFLKKTQKVQYTNYVRQQILIKILILTRF